MRSSTSNSDFENEFQTLNSSNRLKVSAAAIVGIFLVFTTVIISYSQFAKTLVANDRAKGMIDNLSVVVEQDQGKKKVLFFGSSTVEAGFEPHRFDNALLAQGEDVISYNYGVPNLNPEYQALIARRIRSSFEGADEQLALTLIEFNPFQTTKTRKLLGDAKRDQSQAVLMSVDELLEVTLRDPGRGLQLLTIRFLRGGLSAELLTSEIAEELVKSPSLSAELERARQSRYESLQLFLATLPENSDYFGDEAWDRSLRGGRADKGKLSDDSLVALNSYSSSYRHSELMRNDLQRRVVQGDILDLDFHEELILAFIEMVNTLSSVSDQIEILLMPRNTQWISYTPEVQNKLEELMQRISDATGVNVRNWQDDSRITPEDFTDTTHLSFTTGIDRFTDLLVEEYGERL